jgi:peptidyl-prolyl cis-trans isomerase B (cyclophilin B)
MAQQLKQRLTGILYLCTLSLVLVLSACGTSETPGTERTILEPFEVDQLPVVTIEMENGDMIKAELYPHYAPNTVLNFISLIEQGFYDGTIFHRVIPGFMIQGGDPQGLGTGGPGYTIRGEFENNNFENPLKHERGVLSMARTRHPDSAGSQFFVMVANTPQLDRDYAAFGRVIEGIEAVDRIVMQPRNPSDRPLEEQRMKRVTVETFGISYDPPVKLE